ncbi:RNA-binding protein [Chitinophaga caeni]|uniref:RNA-binding protein n=1 Tax=Chitinophaga caeni TaxID=2029983 RepID=A0A291QPZ3_9BACT|nr:S1-like domain-containing RNA-binding protein [Chitinophaga caeni]ATL46001.1 RNA-binding protein [Chitinophaga caeni]
MVKIGQYNHLRVKKLSDFGVFLDGYGELEILMPKRFVPKDTKVGDELEVFIYHDSENRLTATTQKPKGIVGDIVNLKAVSTTPQGAFLDWGLMKDIFVPLSQQVHKMIPGQEYLVKIYLDERTGRVAATEKLERFLSNDELSVNILDPVKVTIYRRTDLGFVVIINNKHTGILHKNEIFRPVDTGETYDGYIKNIKRDKIDVVLGKPGYDKVEDEVDKVLRLLNENDGYLPYHDKSDPEEIYDFFGMSKKTFKMITGNLYKQKKIIFTQTGIKLITD